MPLEIRLTQLAHNLWWSWDDEAVNLWPRLSADSWSACHHNPVALLQAATDEQWSSWKTDEDLCRQVEHLADKMRSDLSNTGWADDAVPNVQHAGVLYLSMEFGLHESLRLYSGGLGVLAGDHLRSASDLGLNLTGVSLLWREGYFQQRIEGGEQTAEWMISHPQALPLERVESQGSPLVIHVPMGESAVALNVWRLQVGRAPLYLLDADHPDNPQAIRDLTQRLYGGGHEARIRQEILLGLGGVRLAEALDLPHGLIHLNEGHCAFASLQLAARELRSGVSWEEACARARARTVFTTHTPVPAGHDRFHWPQTNELLGPWRSSLGLPEGAFMDLGRVHPHDLDEPLCMTVLALRLSAAANGVSKLHGAVSREMWKEMWPGRAEDDVPIGHITNGVHPTFWVAQPSRDLFDAHLPGWRTKIWDTELWSRAAEIPDDAIRSMRDANRRSLVELVRHRTGTVLDPNALTLGFARRFATYKRGDLIARDPARLEAILESGAQVVYAGKAHPADEPGQQVLARIVALTKDPRFRGRIVLIPDYDMEVGRAITAGADVWLNNPRRPREASGTSGQKVVYNGGLNASILDGWWDEGYDGFNGWAIGEGQAWDGETVTDASEAEALYQVLEHQILPLWNQPGWADRIRRGWMTCAPAFSSHRMVRDYALDLYRSRCV